LIKHELSPSLLIIASSQFFGITEERRCLLDKNLHPGPRRKQGHFLLRGYEQERSKKKQMKTADYPQTDNLASYIWVFKSGI